MVRLYRFLGSLWMAVALLAALAITLSAGTLVEARYGTPAAQHYFYQAPWFQILLLFLAVNLIVSALHRLPWKRRHAGFVMTHLGIIVILTGNLLGIWFGEEGTLTIREGETAESLQLPRDMLWLQSENPGTPFILPLDFNTRPWMEHVQQEEIFQEEGKPLRVTIDRYLPNASVTEAVLPGEAEFPAVRMTLSAFDQEETVWLFSRDPERFGFQWGPAHILFGEVSDDKTLSLLEEANSSEKTDEKGTLHLEFTEQGIVREIPVGAFLGKNVPLEGTSYTLSLREYFPDFIITDEGPASRSDEPNNPAVSFTLKGPEGEDAFLVFALHPEFEARHAPLETGQGVKRLIPVKATYETPVPPLPPNLVGVIRSPEAIRVVVTSSDGTERKMLPFSVGETYQHPWMDFSFRILEYLPKAKQVREFHLKDRDVKNQAIHLEVERGENHETLWLPYGEVAHLSLGEDLVVLTYQPAQTELPFSVRLLDFRKVDYPGITVASAFESDLEINDPKRKHRFLKTISMNRPFTYQGYTMFQASFAEEPVETTVLAVRKDPGTPFVYTGFGIVVIGVLLMFYLKENKKEEKGNVA